MTATQPAVFYYDLGNPECYLVAEQINSALPAVPEWEPITGDPPADIDRDRVARRATELGLQRLHWPRSWPPDTYEAMLVATYAKRVGRGVAFSLAAFRQAFAAGRDLTEKDNVLLAAAAAELHPRAMLAAIQRDSVKGALREATDRAADLAVCGVPSVVVGGQVFWGDDRLEEAAAAAADRRPGNHALS